MLVSVYLPTKNRLSLLPGAIDSVLKQTYHELELLIVDDGSTDGTAAYLDALAKQEPRVRVLHNPTSIGGSPARNVAIRVAQGEFITGLDDDDRFHPHRIAGFVEYWQLLETSGERFSLLYSQDIIVAAGPSRAPRNSARCATIKCSVATSSAIRFSAPQCPRRSWRIR